MIGKSSPAILPLSWICLLYTSGADAILLAKNIDGVYSADPQRDPSAVRYDVISYDEVLEKHLGVMDLTATSMAMENKIPVLVFRR